MLNFLKNTAKKIFGTKYDKDVSKYKPLVEQINANFESYQSLSNDELRGKTGEFKERISAYLTEINTDIEGIEKQIVDSEDINQKEAWYADIDKLKEEKDKLLEEILLEILPEAFAVVKETARRFKDNQTVTVKATELDIKLAQQKNHIIIEDGKSIWKNTWKAAGGDITWNMLHYDVQLIGGMVLHDGKIAEMQTGEGKTLVATLPAYLNGLTGLGVHVITVNNYLALRDSEWVGPIFEFLGLTVNCIDKYKPHSPERVEAYKCDIIYGTNNEFGFDYLRDNMVQSAEDKVQRKHHYAMIDEVDSVLIDDARTPLIISGPVPQGSEEQEYLTLKPTVEELISAQRKLATKFLADATKEFKSGNYGIEEGQAGMLLLRAFRAMPRYRPLIKFLSQEGVKVEMQKAENHYMQDKSKNMHIVDKELLFTIDEKNKSVELTEKGTEFLSKGSGDNNFFILPDITSEMVNIDNDSNLSQEEKTSKKTEIYQDFAVKSSRLHSVNQLLKAFTIFEKDVEYIVMDNEVKIVDEQTGRMMEGRRYSDGLHQALEAKENVEIGNITQTYATVTLQNYFRMYHKLAGMTGTAETEAGELWEIYKLDVVVIPTNRPIQRDDREDLVFKTAREKFNAVADEIVRMSEAGRPVLVGTTSVDISEKLSRVLKMRNIKHNVLNAKQHQREAEVVTEAGKGGQVTIATNMAGRGTDIKLSDEVKQAGGLAIIGTERHDSRRVDRQLRGRAGRQGDVGSSQFYVSLEDDLMRKFGSDRLAAMMDKMGHQDGEILQHSMVTKSIERAQKKVEENSFGIRKRLLEYDDVMNIQREAIYKKRNNALSGARFAVDLNNMFESMAETLVHDFHGQQNGYEAFKAECIKVLGLAPTFDQNFFESSPVAKVTDTFTQAFKESYKLKFEEIQNQVYTYIKYKVDTENIQNKFKFIAVPLTDGRANPFVIRLDIQETIDNGPAYITKSIEKAISLAIIDEEWKDHLRSMDELKETSQTASFQQKDPLVIYKIDAFKLFEDLIFLINEKVSSFLSKVKLYQEDAIQGTQKEKVDMSHVNQSRGTEQQEAAKKAAEAVSQGNNEIQKPKTVVRAMPKVGRNEACPCGSGKKFKQCHGKK